MTSVSGAITVILCFSLASSAFAQSIKFNGETYDLVERGAIIPDELWKFRDGQAKILFVCWENPQSDFAGDMDAVRLAVKSSWQSHSKLQFLGWGKCAENSPGIRILVKDDASEGPGVGLDFGRKIDGVKNGMILNFTFKNWLPACEEGAKSVWITRIAVHEFGHAIGFHHEQDRNDAIGKDMAGRDCKKKKTGPNPDWHVTTYDAKSIMNYCYCEGTANLSALDIVSVQALYGSP